MIAVDPPVRILIFPLASEGPSTHACSRQDWPRCSDGRSRTATPAARRYRPLMALTLRICQEFCPVTCGPGFAAIARQTSPGLAGSGAAMGYFVLDLNRRQILPVWCGRRSIDSRGQGPGRPAPPNATCRASPLLGVGARPALGAGAGAGRMRPPLACLGAPLIPAARLRRFTIAARVRSGQRRG